MTVEGVTTNGVVMRWPGEGPATWAMGSLFEHLVGAADVRAHRRVFPPPAQGCAARVPDQGRLAGPFPVDHHARWLMGLYDEVGIPAAERRLPGDDGLSMAEETGRWNEVAPRYGLDVVGPPIPE